MTEPSEGMTEVTEDEPTEPAPPRATVPAAVDGSRLLAGSSALLASRLMRAEQAEADLVAEMRSIHAVLDGTYGSPRIDR